ncbi:MAG: ABC transporter ATP-binding protein [Chloroflexi bacterium]|nr:ABC transporter ATP-binding protein [Chloroflexota bacterium]
MRQRLRNVWILIRLLGFLRPYKRGVAVALLSLFATAGFQMAGPWLVKEAIDKGLGFDAKTLAVQGNMTTLVTMALLIAGAALLRGFFGYWQTYLGEYLSQSVAYDIRNAIYDRLQRLSFAFHDKAQTGQLMSRATADVEAARMFTNAGTLRITYVTVLFIAVTYLLISLNGFLALVVFLCLPLVAYRAIVTSLKLRPIWLQVQEGIADLGTMLQENLSGMRVVKAFAREKDESHKWAVKAEYLYDRSYTSSRIQAFNTPFMTFILLCASALILYVGGRQVIDGRMAIGELAAFNLYLVMMAMPVRTMGFMANIIARAISSGQRIFEVLDAESAVKEKPTAIEMRDIQGRVRFDNVSFGYDALSPVLRGVDFEAEPGQIIALLGATGSGKSTVINLLPRFYDVTEGAITIDGIDIRDVTLNSLRRCIGMVQQDIFLFTATIRDNIAYGSVNASDEEIIAATKAAQLHDFIDSLPEGYDTWVGERGVTLSGGQKQRLAIARTLLLDPRILIFDDSTSSVDMETEYLIQKALAELMRGRTTFVIAQRLRTVKSADQILVLQRGRIVERGTHEDLMDRGGIYREIYDLQLRDQEEALVGSAAHESGA